MEKRLEEITGKFRENGIEVSEREAESVRSHCFRKMDMCGIKNKEEYLPLLYEDELRHYLFGKTINAITYLRMTAKEEEEKCVASA